MSKVATAALQAPARNLDTISVETIPLQDLPILKRCEVKHHNLYWEVYFQYQKNKDYIGAIYRNLYQEPRCRKMRSKPFLILQSINLLFVSN